jgi:hypothetical protein
MHTDPPAWRRLLVPGGLRMDKLSKILQITMGWNNSHLHVFLVGELSHGMHADDYPEDEIDETEVTIHSALLSQRRVVYEYDFGDGWEHDIAIESATRQPFGLKFAVCIDGQHACPPDDIGGPGGYRNFLAVVADPAHKEHQSYVEWYGSEFDPFEFDLGVINAELQRLK